MLKFNLLASSVFWILLILIESAVTLYSQSTEFHRNGEFYSATNINLDGVEYVIIENDTTAKSDKDICKSSSVFAICGAVADMIIQASPDNGVDEFSFRFNHDGTRIDSIHFKLYGACGSTTMEVNSSSLTGIPINPQSCFATWESTCINNILNGFEISFNLNDEEATIEIISKAGCTSICATRSFNFDLVHVQIIDASVPERYYLQNNYPNPFNPETTIKYAVPELCFVKLNVFDILGSQLAILTNEEKSAGTYEITWNTENLPSGVYFYRLQAGDFVETKKMVLMK